MLGKSSLLWLVVLSIELLVFSAGEALEENPEILTTKRSRFTRRTTPIEVSTLTIETDGNKNMKSSSSSDGSSTIIGVLNESTDTKQSNETFTSIESSIVTGAPTIVVEIATKKSLHVRNCGERIGDDVPFIAILVHTNPSERKSAKQKKSLSKGVLVAENFVLATVSSIYHSEPFWTVSSVRLGDFVTWNKYANRDKSNSIEVAVDEIFYHQKRDLAMIKLQQSVSFSETIRPACLPLSDSYNFKDIKTHQCKRSRNGRADVTLDSAAPLSSFDCKQFFDRKNIAISQHDFCVWDEVDDDCTGEIGNPLFTTHNGRLFVIGLRSYAESDDEFLDPEEYPGIYVKIGSLLDWISKVMSLAQTQ